MPFNCKVLNIYNTSLGKVAIIGLYDDLIPKIGDCFKNKSNLKWKITGIGANRIFELKNDYLNDDFKSIWDLKIEPLDHIVTLEVGENLDMRN